MSKCDTTESSNNKIIVIDADNVLVDVDLWCDNCPRKCRKHHVFKVNNFDYDWYLHIRPHCKEFLKWCSSKRYDIVLFSAADQIYVNTIAQILFKTLDVKPIAVMSVNHMQNYAYDGKGKTLLNVANHLGIPMRNMIGIDSMRGNFENDTHIMVSKWDRRDAKDDALRTIRKDIDEMFANK